MCYSVNDIVNKLLVMSEVAGKLKQSCASMPADEEIHIRL